MRRIRDDIVLLDYADYRVMPWKNGGGTTREVFAHGATESGFDWRLSIADVASDGPFSSFAGYARSILLLDGRGMRLRFDGADEVRIDEPFRPFDFDGGANTVCTLIDGPVRDFNIMSARSRVRHEHAILRDFPCSDAGGVQAIHCLEGALAATLDDGIRIEMARGATLIAHDPNRPVRRIDGAPGSIALRVLFHSAD